MASLTQDQNFWIFLCFGQSNMAGQAPIEEQDLMVSDRFLSMATTDGPDRQLGTWRKAVPPLCRADANLGPADWFGRTLLEAVPENVRIGIVSVAVEGCPITFFDKDQNARVIASEDREWMNDILNQYGRDPYKRLLSMAKIAARDGVIKGILLHQGETDAYDREWQETVRKNYCDLQQELQFNPAAVPLLVGEVVRSEYGGICGHANPTINDMANRYPNTYVVSSVGCLPCEDNLHFCGEGYRLLGRHYAQRYLEVTNHFEIPQIGVGTWTLRGETARQNVCLALKAGFRHIDTAQGYENETEVGQGIIDSGVPRQEIFLTTKVATNIMREGREAVRKSIDESLTKLKTDYIDLLLIHWPVKDCVKDTWQVLEDYVRQGKVKFIGVSNFNRHHLDDLLSYAEIRPVINQIEVHPFMTQEENIAYNRRLGIQVEAWGPFGQGDIDVVGHPLLQSLAAKYQKTASQIVLRWIVQRGLITIPRAKPNHFAENLEIMTFSLSDDDMKAISGLNQNLRSNVLNDPETFPW